LKTYRDFNVGELTFEFDLAAPVCFLIGWNFRTRVIAIGVPFLIVSWSY